jgi:phosphoserine phosphatase RsbU/P
VDMTKDAERFQDVLDSLDPHIALLDRSGVIVAVNAAWERFAAQNGVAHAHQYGVGMNYLDVCDVGNGDEHARAARQGVLDILAGRRASFTLQYPCHAPDVERWYLLTVRPLPRNEGGAVVIHTDVTVSYTAQEKVRQQERRFTSLIEHAVDLIMVVTRDEVITYQSPALQTILGYSHEEAIGMLLLDLLHLDDAPDIRAALANIARVPYGTTRREFRMRHRNGSWRWLEARFTNLLDDPDVLGTVVNARDIIERKQLIEERDHLYLELQEEMDRAAVVQTHLLPTQLPELPGYLFAGICLPAREVGGDFFDWSGDAERVRLSVGDVTGKGMPAALLMATTRAALRSVSNLPVAEAVTAVNRALAPDLEQSNAFVTLFHAELDTTGRGEFADAGHGMAFVLRSDGAIQELQDQDRGLPIGILRRSPYDAATLYLESGDRLVIYSDGLPDSRPDLELASRGIAEQCARLADPDAMLRCLVSLADKAGKRPDDLTIVIVKRR